LGFSPRQLTLIAIAISELARYILHATQGQITMKLATQDDARMRDFRA
jgi:hypothetical protein